MFRVVDPPGSSGVAIVAQTPSFVTERGKLHPVVAWGRENADEALTWWKEVAA